MRLENLLNAQRRKLFLLLVIGVVLGGGYLNALNLSKTKTFKGTPDQVFNAAVKVAQLNWHVTFLDRETRTLSFHDFSVGDVACSVVVDDLHDGTVRVTLGMQTRSSTGVGTLSLDLDNQITSELFTGIGKETTSPGTATPAWPAPSH
jgi:hypothetical protein